MSRTWTWTMLRYATLRRRWSGRCGRNGVAVSTRSGRSGRAVNVLGGDLADQPTAEPRASRRPSSRAPPGPVRGRPAGGPRGRRRAAPPPTTTSKPSPSRPTRSTHGDGANRNCPELLTETAHFGRTADRGPPDVGGLPRRSWSLTTRAVEGRVARGISAPGSRRSRRNSLPLPGSCHPDHQTDGTEGTHSQCANRRGARLTPGRRREFHPPPPTDPDVNLSVHPARAVQFSGRQ